MLMKSRKKTKRKKKIKKEMAGLLQGIPEFNNDNNHCDKIGEQLKCPTCQKMFDTPLLLPCMHTFCLK